jgi:type I restriction enzyme S subunit
MGGEPRRWRDCKLGDVLELKRGYDLPQQRRHPGNVPVVSSSGPSGFHSEAMVKAPGVITGRYGTLGEVFFVTHDFWPLNTTLYVRDFKGSDPKFVSYFLKTIDYHSCSDKAAVPGVNRNHLHELLVRVPPLAEQQAIARILGALDDKIELNRKMNATLEAMARALFKSWFVDFDPVRAKAVGRAPSGMDAETAKLFPSEFVESQVGSVPRGWRITTWGTIAALEYGKGLRGYDNAGGDVPVWGTNGQIGWHTEALCPHPGIIVGRKGAYRGIHFCDRPFFVIDTAFYLRSRQDLSWRWAFYELKRFDLNGMDSGSAIPSTSRDQFYGIPVCVPPLALQRRFDATMAAAWSSQGQLKKESQTLARLRDELLPRLLSGALDVGPMADEQGDR